ncbi:MAG: ABC transporter ATP-binding protein [Ectothiorhodospiraceae bacterium]|nr:ABC transporter ATP-binding protein [Ectothiorhodospiraceae bacterium]MCH8505296.1 ABC transporter ATP-binding protein [Ectothiorhodospiraceae bacterium]
MKQPLLTVEDLTVEFQTRAGIVQVLDRINLTLHKGETLAVVGESGSGKSVGAFSIMGILDPAARIRSGSIRFDGMDLLTSSAGDLNTVRGREMAMIFQSPATALNPIRKVGQQIEDVLRRHGPVTRREARRRAVEALAQVRIPDPERRYHAYPFELSGGLCQRVMIAIALCCQPRLLIADEPTTGLDVTTQAAIMDLVRDLGRERNMATMLITHDLALAAQYADRIMVMHAGQVVETAPTDALFSQAAHPYTAGLMKATPTEASSLDELKAIPGSLPDLKGSLPPCRFAGRCERRESRCDDPGLALAAVGTDDLHRVACRRPL